MTFEELETIVGEMDGVDPKRYAHGYDVGPKYIKIWRATVESLREADTVEDTHRSAVAFVDASTGKWYVADSWKKRGKEMPPSLVRALRGVR